MIHLHDIQPQMRLRGIRSGQTVRVLVASPAGDALFVVYKTDDGTLAEEYLYTADEERLQVVSGNSDWSFTGDGGEFRFALEAERIRLAHLFDPYLALSTSSVEPLPHQIAAVYQEMLPRLPLRYVLADDPGAGKTIMTGLLAKELALRGALERCLIVCPGNLAEQWQDELEDKFGLHFALLTGDALRRSRSENPFETENLLIARLDMLARSDALKEMLSHSRWDLVVCDEAHKMSATISGREVRATQRYKLGQLLSGITENLLLLTATPHNGKEADFQLFMSLIDKDRFDVLPGRPLAPVDVSDVMRRLVKEELLRFDGRPLFPERRVTTVHYELSREEQQLYDHVTQYVREQFNLADRLEGSQRNTVGFALMVLQRRLASSPEAIYQSLRRRRSRLVERRSEIEQGNWRAADGSLQAIRTDDLREGVLSSEEEEEQEERLVDGATAAHTVEELDAEISVLSALEDEALVLCRSGRDQKWNELRSLLQTRPMQSGGGRVPAKLIVFTEHRDTINYLRDRIGTLLGRPEAIAVIHGGLNRVERRHVEEEFRNNPDVQILLATDAAGEGVNLQCCHLVVNYDLPWNPNRIEQRFGRVHRIGQEHTCHLWNLVSAQTREGRVYEVLLKKLGQEQKSLPGKVFDILGEIRFGDNSLRELLIEAVRSDSSEKVEQTIVPLIEDAMRTERLLDLVRERALSHDAMDLAMVTRIRADMERMEARRLQPHFIEAFTVGAIRAMGGRIVPREKGRYEISRLPFAVKRENPRLPSKYDRICFEKKAVRTDGKRTAELITPDHILLQSVIGAVSKEYALTLRNGAFLIDDSDLGTKPRLLFGVETTITDGSDKISSRQMHFIELTLDGEARGAGPAPYLDYRAPSEGERNELLKYLRHQDWDVGEMEDKAHTYAVSTILQTHRDTLQEQMNEKTERVRAAVNDRLVQEQMYLRKQKSKIRMDSKTGPARRTQIETRYRDIGARLERRLQELDKQKDLHPRPPRITTGAMIIPRGLVGEALHRPGDTAPDAESRRSIELAAMAAVETIERRLGYIPHDISAENVGYDIESAVPESKRTPDDPVLRFIEVKGRAKGADIVMVTKNEILTALNSPDQYILAIVEVDNDTTVTTYLKRPFHSPPDFGATAVGYNIEDLKKNGQTVLTERGTRSYAQETH